MKNAGKSLIVVAGILGLAVSSVHAAIWFNQNAEINVVEASTWYGSASAETGRWGTFRDSNGRVSTEQAHSGTKSLRVVGGYEGIGAVMGRTSSGTFGSGKSSQKKFTLSLWVRQDAGAGNIIMFGDPVGWKSYVGVVYIRPTGQVELNRDGRDYTPFSTTTLVAADTWAELKLEYDLTAGDHGEVTATLGGTILGTLALEKDFMEASDRLTFNAQGISGSKSYFDDIKLEVLP